MVGGGDGVGEVGGGAGLIAIGGGGDGATGPFPPPVVPPPDPCGTHERSVPPTGSQHSSFPINNVSRSQFTGHPSSFGSSLS